MFGAGLEGGEFFLIDVHGEDPRFVVREGTEVEGFAAGTGAGIDDAFAGFWV